MSECPLARSEGLVVEPLDDELLVFDSRADRAHSLNATAAAVWRACDGARTRAQLAAHCDVSVLAVDMALQSLMACDLLVDYTATRERVSRRAVLRRVAVSGVGLGVALPVIRSVTAPSAAMAGSTARGGSCTSQSQCHSSSFCTSRGVCNSRGPSTGPNVINGPCDTSRSSCPYGTHCQPSQSGGQPYCLHVA